MMPPMETLIRDIKAFCIAHNMPETTFGQKALNDPAFMYALRNGRDPRYSTVERVKNFMVTYKP